MTNNEKKHIISEDMKQRIIDAAHQDIERGHEDADCIDRTETEVQVLLGLLKIIDEQKDRIGVLERTIAQMPKPVKLLDVFGDNYEKIVRCKNCRHRSTSQCPCQYSGDPYYSWDPDDDWFCADGEN